MACVNVVRRDVVDPLKPPRPRLRRALAITALIVAGEAVFALPFHVARFFRPSVLELFGLSNTELGAAQAVYGVVAMLAYFPGGPLADRFPARKLLAWSLWTTAAGGLYMATLPGYRGALVLWGLFGCTTILLFWAALIRATREWGEADEQGRAFGLLEGGRGALSALLATAGAGLFFVLFPEGYDQAGLAERERALRLIIYGYTALTAATGCFVWWVLPQRSRSPVDAPVAAVPPGRLRWSQVARVLRLPAVWMTSVIVVCAYVGYKGFDNYSLYAVQGFGLDEVEAARIVAIAAWMRPLAALGAGLLGDRLLISRMTVICFALLALSQALFALLTPGAGMTWLLLTNVLAGSAAIFGLRGLYFALFEEARVPLAVTGTAVGVVSVIGYTPDIFVSYLGGVILDHAPGLPGHQHYFAFQAAFAVIGLAVSLALVRMLHRRWWPARLPATS